MLIIRPGGVAWYADTVSNLVAVLRHPTAQINGQLPFQGQLAVELQNAIAIMSGEQPTVGVLDSDLQRLTASLTGVMAPEGTLAAAVQRALFAGVGGMAPQGVLQSALQPATAALTGTHTQQGSIAAILQKATAALAGGQGASGTSAVTLQRATAALVGNQPFTATSAVVLQKATAALAGSQTHSGTIAASLQKATATLAGAQTHSGTMGATLQKATATLGGTIVSATQPVITSSNVGTTSATFGAHNIGDLLVICSYRDAINVSTKPGAGGTVPAFVDIDAVNGANSNSIRTAYFVATATNHTSGTWTSAARTIAVVIAGQHSTPIGGHDQSGNTSATITAPAITMSNIDGTSLLMHFHGARSLNGAAFATAPAGYTRVIAGATNGAPSLCMNVKDNTTTDGSVGQDTANTGGANGNRGATIEITQH